MSKHTPGSWTAPFTSWLWPDHRIGIRESCRLREEHNALVNSHAELLEVLIRISAVNYGANMTDWDAVRYAIAKASKSGSES